MEKKSIFITGASGGIGKHIVEFFESKDYNVFALYNNHKPDFSEKVEIYKTDLTSPSQVNSAVTEYFKNHDTLDVLIMSHALSKDGFITDVDAQDFRKVIDVNLIGSFNIVKEILPYMQKQNYGNIINIGSIVGETGGVGCSAYSASKAATHNLTQSIAKENSRYNIFANTLELGYINEGLGLRLPENVKSKIEHSIPLKKSGEITDVLEAIDFLTKTKYMTGSKLNLTGGL